jgi:GTP pyrophosphokinase
MLGRELTHVGKDIPAFYNSKEMKNVLEAMGYQSVEELWLSVGFGKINTKQVLGRLIQREPRKTRKVETATGEPLLIREVDGVQYRRALCCNPVPGEPIVGIITKSRGISIHHQECANVRRFTGEQGRKIPLHWEGETGERYEVILEIRAQDRHRLLADITTEIASTGTNIAGSRTHADGSRAHLHFTIEVIDIKHLNRIVSRLVGIDGVKSVYRRKRVV